MEDLLPKVISFGILLFNIAWHESAHALAAHWCGDDTAKNLGRISLNPIPHIDLWGTLIIPLINIFTPGAFMLVGWGKPVPVDPRYFKHPRRDDILVSLAGPFSNLILFIVTLLIIRLLTFIPEQQAGIYFQYLIIPMAGMSIMLCLFNLLPIPPLDGSHLLFAFLPYNIRKYYGRISMASFIIMIVLINTPVWRYFGMLITKVMLVGMKYIGGVEF
ncbi:site-2 protease family protein [bacterium]|nr:site-2 protease family protein [bacterium]